MWSRGSDRCAPPKSGGRKLSSTSSLGYRKGTRAQRLCLPKYPGNEPLGITHRKVPVGSGEITAYFGKRRGLTLGSWHQASNLVAYFRDTTLAWLYYFIFRIRTSIS